MIVWMIDLWQSSAYCKWNPFFHHMLKGLTALMYAIQNEHVMVVKELLLAGTDATAKDRVWA